MPQVQVQVLDGKMVLLLFLEIRTQFKSEQAELKMVELAETVSSLA